MDNPGKKRKSPVTASSSQQPAGLDSLESDLRANKVAKIEENPSFLTNPNLIAANYQTYSRVQLGQTQVLASPTTIQNSSLGQVTSDLLISGGSQFQPRLLIGDHVTRAAQSAQLLASRLQQLSQTSLEVGVGSTAHPTANPHHSLSDTTFSASMSQPIVTSVAKPAAVSLAHKDTKYTKIFVGGLPYHTTDESLRDFFLVFGEIEEAVVITDRQTGKSKGYGFVSSQ